MDVGYSAMARRQLRSNSGLNCSLIQRTTDLTGVQRLSGLETKGSFNEVIVPALLKVFTKD